MDLLIFLKVFIICLVGAMAPGPSMLVVVNNSLCKNRLHGLLTAIGHGIGIIMYALISNILLIFLININLVFFKIIQFCGILFMLYLGYRIFKTSIKTNDLDNQADRYIQSIFQGFLIAILNPKVLVWFISIYSQLISPSNDFQFILILILTAGIVDTGWYSFLALIVTTSKINLILKSKINLLCKFSGILLIIIGLIFFVKILI